MCNSTFKSEHILESNKLEHVNTMCSIGVRDITIYPVFGNFKNLNLTCNFITTSQHTIKSLQLFETQPSSRQMDRQFDLI